MIFIEQDKYKTRYGIYSIRNIKNNKRYIGQTSENFQRRYWHHKWKLSDNTHDNDFLQSSWNKYGASSFVFEVIEIVDDVYNLDSKEIEYIKYYKKIGLCFNMLLGGGGRRGFKMKENTKKLIGNKNRLNMFGKKHTLETREKMSLSRKNKKYAKYRKTTIITDEIARNIKIMLIDGVSASDVAKHFNISYKIVNNILSNSTWSDVIVDKWDDFLKSRNKTYRLSKEDVDIIRSLYNNGMLIKDISNVYNKCRTTISNIIHYKTFK